jgi:hypothetical protein
MLGVNKFPVIFFFSLILMLSILLAGCSTTIEPGLDTSGDINGESRSDAQPPTNVDPYAVTYVDTTEELAKFDASEAEEVPILLKIGHLFILYSYPKAPYLGNGRLMVSAKLTEDLMGGQFLYDQKKQKATITLLGHQFEFHADSVDAVIDGKPIELGVNPTVEDGFLYIPLNVLLAYTDIEWSWTEREQGPPCLWINDPRVIKGDIFDMFVGNDAASIIDPHALDLLSYKLDTRVLDHPYMEAVLMIKAKNVSRRAIPEGKTDINPLFKYYVINSYGEEMSLFSVMPYTREGDPKFPIVKDEEDIVRTRTIHLCATAYIISPGRMMK